MLPKSFGCWQTVYGYFNTWRAKGIWQQIHQTLSHSERQRQGRKPIASAGSIDSQSVKTATQCGIKGYDAGKKVNGRKQHLLVDTLGLIISVFVSPANCLDRDGLMQLLRQYFSMELTRLRKLWVDGGYRGDDLKDWVAGLKGSHKIDLEVVNPLAKDFKLSRDAGWLRERSLGCLIADAFPRITKS